jgi:hypothetical protein
MFVACTDCIFLTPPLQCHRRLRTQLTPGQGTVTNAGRRSAGTLAGCDGVKRDQPGWVLVSRVAYVQVRAPTGGMTAPDFGTRSGVSSGAAPGVTLLWRCSPGSLRRGVRGSGSPVAPCCGGARRGRLVPGPAVGPAGVAGRDAHGGATGSPVAPWAHGAKVPRLVGAGRHVAKLTRNPGSPPQCRLYLLVAVLIYRSIEGCGGALE